MEDDTLDDQRLAALRSEAADLAQEARIMAERQADLLKRMHDLQQPIQVHQAALDNARR